VLAAKERFATQFTIDAMVARHEALYAAVRQPGKSDQV
jgi:hypothetical protein